MTTINKNFFIAPSTTGLGAMRWAAMLLLAVMMLTTAQTAWATDKTLSGSDNYTAQDGDVLTGSTSGTMTIANNANITLNNATISGGIVCEGSATITLVGTNNVTGAYQKAGIQIGGSGTTLTIKGDGSLTANGGYWSAGIGLSAIFNYDNDVRSGDIIIEGGTITATGGYWGAGIGTGIIKNTKNDNSTSVQFGNVTIKGGTVTATDGGSGDGIGKGYSYYGPSITFGIVTIYNGINMVDASSIKNSESIVYMYDETDVTANASNYFTITEDGNRRIIVPKDDTDYTITIANDIEHGTLTGAATAKYMEKVTITATPDLGYRLIKLVVKDAQNNDVASTGNSFFMPKSNVTISAVFEQGTHGTTEFKWEYDPGQGPQSIVEETIYNGVTTENIQQGGSYQIKNADHNYLIIDNNVSNVSIPYSGGTGTFMTVGTNFALDSQAPAGYYDITMTDAGNGKWSVSILKTVGVIDNIPDQTYTGSEIKPEPLVMAGSLSLTKGTDYEYSYTNNTNVGTAKVTVTFKGDYASLGSVEKEFTITKATPTVTAPTAIADLVYTGSAQALVTGGTTDVGDILSYCLEENGMYSADIPTGTNAGTYTVYYKVDGSDNWNAVAGGTVEVNIALALADAADNSAAITAHADKTLVVALSGCTLYKDGSWNTLCLPFDVDLNATDCPLYGATARSLTAASVSGTTLNLTFGDAVNTLEAGTPYIIKWDGDGTSNIENPVFEGVNIDATKHDYDTNAESVTTDERVRFVGTYKSTEFASEDKSILLMGGENTLYYPAEGAGIGSFRAYFKIGGDDSALLARRLTSFSIDFGEDEEEATGIVEVEANTSLSTLQSSLKDAWHTLDGRRLQGKPTQGGIYIKNGKKITVK